MTSFIVQIKIKADGKSLTYSDEHFKADNTYDVIHIVEEDVRRLMGIARARWTRTCAGGVTRVTPMYATYEITALPGSGVIPVEWSYKAVTFGDKWYVYDSEEDLFLFLAEETAATKKTNYETFKSRPIQCEGDEGSGDGHTDVPGEDVP